MIQKITPFFWFDQQAEEAVNFYVEVFKNASGASGNSEIKSMTWYDEAGSKAANSQ